MAEFTQMISEPSPQARVLGAPPVDTTTAQAINAASKTIERGVDIFEAAQRSDVEASINSFREKLVNIQVKADQTGDTSSGIIQANTLLKGAINEQPLIAKELRSVTKEVTGFNVAEKSFQLEEDEEADRRELQDRVTNTFIDTAVGAGIVHVNEDGSINEQLTADAGQQILIRQEQIAKVIANKDLSADQRLTSLTQQYAGSTGVALETFFANMTNAFSKTGGKNDPKLDARAETEFTAMRARTTGQIRQLMISNGVTKSERDSIMSDIDASFDVYSTLFTGDSSKTSINLRHLQNVKTNTSLAMNEIAPIYTMLGQMSGAARDVMSKKVFTDNVFNKQLEEGFNALVDSTNTITGDDVKNYEGLSNKTKKVNSMSDSEKTKFIATQQEVTLSIAKNLQVSTVEDFDKWANAEEDNLKIANSPIVVGTNLLNAADSINSNWKNVFSKMSQTSQEQSRAVGVQAATLTNKALKKVFRDMSAEVEKGFVFFDGDTGQLAIVPTATPDPTDTIVLAPNDTIVRQVKKVNDYLENMVFLKQYTKEFKGVPDVKTKEVITKFLTRQQGFTLPINNAKAAEDDFTPPSTNLFFSFDPETKRLSPINEEG